MSLSNDDILTTLAERRRVFERYLSLPSVEALLQQSLEHGDEFTFSTCPCCGYPVHSCGSYHENCVICGWEDDGQDDSEFAPFAGFFTPDEIAGGPNGNYSLTEARINFARHGHMYRQFDTRMSEDKVQDRELREALVSHFESLLPTTSESAFTNIVPLITEARRSIAESFSRRYLKRMTRLRMERNDEVTDIATYSRREVTQSASRLRYAQRGNFLCIAEGDDGGQTYFTIPSQQVMCSAEELAGLVFDVDYMNWEEPQGVRLWFHRVDIGEHFGGGMGGARATGAFWIHETMAGSILANRIESVLRGDRLRVWPSGSSEFGRPNNPAEVVNLLDEESGDAPIFETIRSAVKLQKEQGADETARRLFTLMRKFLRAAEARNRIEAAQHLLDAVDASVIADALYDAAAGNVSFPRWGMWRELAIYTLARLAKANGGRPREALEALSSSDSWIACSGVYVFSRYLKTDDQRRLFRPDVFREEFARAFRS